MKPDITFIPAADKYGRFLLLFMALMMGRVMAQDPRLGSATEPAGRSYEELEKYGATNETYRAAMGFFVAALAGHQPAQLPEGVTMEDVSRAASEAFPNADMILDKSIFFYGKLQDETGQPVVGAKIHFRWRGFITLGEVKEEAVSDSVGKFALRNKFGQELYVKVDAPGYYASKLNNGGAYNYAMPYREIFKPDPAEPVIYNFRKKGTGVDLITKDFPPGMGQRVQLRYDGTPVEVDLFKGEKTSDGNGNIKLLFWRDTSEKNARKFNWKLQFSVSGEGILPAIEEFAFQAPKSGYQSPLVIDMPATNQNWQSEVHSNYYIHLSDGKFGRIDFYLYPYNGIFTIHSVINPDGSRNLEPK